MSAAPRAAEAGSAAPPFTLRSPRIIPMDQRPACGRGAAGRRTGREGTGREGTGTAADPPHGATTGGALALRPIGPDGPQEARWAQWNRPGR